MSPLVSVDAYKEGLPGYTPVQAQAYHRESARLADKAFPQDRYVQEHVPLPRIVGADIPIPKELQQNPEDGILLWASRHDATMRLSQAGQLEDIHQAAKDHLIKQGIVEAIIITAGLYAGVGVLAKNVRFDRRTFLRSAFAGTSLAALHYSQIATFLNTIAQNQNFTRNNEFFTHMQ